MRSADPRGVLEWPPFIESPWRKVWAKPVVSIMAALHDHHEAIAMPWNIAQAKQHFSEVVKRADKEPQLIYNRDRAVAALINARDFEAFEAWRRERAAPRSLADEFAELRALAAGDDDPLPDMDRHAVGRPDPFADTVDQGG
jgi:prevent-host-death family protein